MFKFCTWALFLGFSPVACVETLPVEVIATPPPVIVKPVVMAAPESMNYNLQEAWNYPIQGPYGSKDESDGVAVDAEGNVFIGGLFSNTVKFGNTNRTAKTGSDMFVSKISPTGRTLWFESFDSGGDDFLWDLTTDSNGDVLISGGYSGELSINGKTYDARKDGSALFAKIAGSTGQVKWIKTFGVMGLTGKIQAEKVAGGNEIAIDSEGNVITTMTTRSGQIKIGDNFYKGNGVRDSFIIKLSPAGEVLWVYQFLGDGSKRLRAIGINGLDEIVFGHEVIGEITTQAGEKIGKPTVNRTPYGTAGVLTSAGKLKWVEPLYSKGFSNVRGAGGDAEGNAYFTGVITEDAWLGDTAIKGIGSRATFVAKYNSAGQLEWARVLGNEKEDNGGELIVFDGKIAFTGVNQGLGYNVYDQKGQELFTNIHPSATNNIQASVTLFDQNGTWLGSHAPIDSDRSNGGVLAAAPENCLVYQSSFYGEVKYANGDSYKSTNASRPGSPDKDQVITKVCWGENKNLESAVSLLPDTPVGPNPPATLLTKDDFSLKKVGSHGEVYASTTGTKGVMLCFHGTGGSASGWDKKEGKQAFAHAFAAAGWSVVCPSSQNRERGQWSPVNTKKNADVQNVDALLNTLGFAPDTPLVLVGHSNGGGFASRYAVFSDRASSIQVVQFSNAAGLKAVLKHPQYTVPTLFNYALCDPWIASPEVKANYVTLVDRGISAKLNPLDTQYAETGTNNCHEFLNTGTEVLKLLP